MTNFEIERRLKLCLYVRNHPILQLPDDIKDKYLVGLGAVLSKVSVSSPVLHDIYDQWCISISGHTYDAFFPHRQHAKDALTLNRIGIRMFRLTYEFFFDCFYLVELFNPDMTGNVHYYLHDHICGRFTKAALQNVRLLFWKEIQHPSIPKELMAHREANMKFSLSPAKRVLVVANMSAGKSTLINAITGYRVNAVANTACTSRLRYIYNKPVEDGFSVWDKKVFSHNNNVDEVRNSECEVIAFHFHSILEEENICFVDTPGVNNSKNSSHGDITYEAIKRNNYDLLLFVADGRYPGTIDEEYLLKYIASTTKVPILLAVNQLDTYNPQQDTIESVLKSYDVILKGIGINNATVLPTSGWLALLDKLPDETQDVLEVGMEKMYKEKFKNDFYDLPFYITHEHSITIIERTGIALLEKTIAKIVTQQQNE